MTNIVTPPTIDALPPAPQPADTPSEFDSKAFALLAAQVAMVGDFNSAAAATQQNATAANERAVAAASSASAANVSANTAATAATTATTAAGTATSANASAVTAKNAAEAAAAKAISTPVAAPIHAATAKTTPTDADELGISDSAASWGLKKLTFANLKAWALGINLAGLSIATNTTITTSDTVLDALGKLQAQVSAKQNTLVSRTNIKTVNGASLLGSGDLLVDGGGPLIDSLTITYNGNGSIATLTEDGVTKTFTYNGDGTINTVSWPVGRLTRTETYSYTSGVLTGMTAVEA